MGWCDEAVAFDTFGISLSFQGVGLSPSCAPLAVLVDCHNLAPLQAGRQPPDVPLVESARAICRPTAIPRTTRMPRRSAARGGKREGRVSVAGEDEGSEQPHR